MTAYVSTNFQKRRGAWERISVPVLEEESPAEIKENAPVRKPAEPTSLIRPTGFFHKLLAPLGLNSRELDFVVETISPEVKTKLEVLIKGGSLKMNGRHYDVHPLKPSLFVDAIKRYTDFGVLNMSRVGNDILSSIVGPEHTCYESMRTSAGCA